MPIDASIALGVRPPQIESPLNSLAKVLQVRGIQQDQQMGQMKMDEYTRGQEEARTMNQLYQSALNPDGTIDRNKLYAGAASRGLGAKIPALQEKFLALDKTGGEIAHKKGETTKNAVATAEKKVAFFKEQMFNVNDPQTAAQLITAMHSDPDLQPLGMDKVPLDKMLAQIPQDPAQFGEFKAKYALGADKFMADLRAKAQQAETGRHNLATEKTSAGQLAVSQGQLGVSRQNLNLRSQELAHNKGQSKAPPGYRFQPDGSLQAIPGGPADIKAGEAGAKREAATRGGIAQADRVISKVDEALGRVGKTSAGFGGSVMAKVPGSGATDLRADLETIKANLGFAELQAMRDASPTGGALGAIAVQELIALQSTVASLDPAQSPAKLESNLKQVKTHYENWKATLEGRLPGSPPTKPPAPTAAGGVPAMSDIDAELARRGKKP